MHDLLTQIGNTPIEDWIAVATGFIYILLATRNNPACWIFGIISCGIWTVSTWVNYQLLADAVLQFTYVLMGIAGLYKWYKGSSDNVSDPGIERIGLRHALIWIAIGFALSFPLSYVLSNYTQAASSGLDSITTIFSLIATLWLVNRKLDNWIIWIIVDSVYVYLYMSRGAILFAGLYVIYTAFAVYGLFHWKRLYAAQVIANSE